MVRQRRETNGAPNPRRRVATASELFEQQIHRVYELLQRFEADVTWNDHVVDPDQPERTRQIDITIRRGEHLTLVECRCRRSRQDVTWIEEFIGRRHSLQANAVIAVSSAGFTAGAIRKARSHGIVTCGLRELTDDEVSAWGRSVALRLFFYQYSDVALTLVFDRGSLPRLDLSALKDELARYPGVQSIFNAAAKIVSQRLRPRVEDEALVATFGFRVVLEQFRLCGEPVMEVGVEGKARLVSQEVLAPTVSAYGASTNWPAEHEAVIQRFSLGETAIVHDGDRISTFIDLSHLAMPPLHQFRYVEVRADGVVDHEVFSLVGVEKLYVQNGTINIAIVGQDGVVGVGVP